MADFGREGSVEAAAARRASIRPSRQPLAARNPPTWVVAIPLALIVAYAFIPTLDNGFIMAWDDDENFLDNPYFRGLGADQMKWAWTTFRVGAYQPLAWVLYGAQYVFWQLDPRAYHLTSVVLQVTNAVVLYVLTMALNVRCRTDLSRQNRWACSLTAGLATALFAAHPLRVEAVAWVSCQMYLPCILFSMLSVLAYLRAFPRDSSPRWRWLVGSFLLFVTALLFHALPVTLPAVLLILDVYPLRRIPDQTGRWFGPDAWRALLEKIPFVLVSLLFMVLAIVAKPQSQFPVQHQNASAGVARACYAIWFYIVKTIVPLDLVAMHPSPRTVDWFTFPFNLSILATVVFSAALFLLRRRWPGLLVAWLSYLVILAPSSGIVSVNIFITADRYSYLPMLGFVIPAAAGLHGFWWTGSRWRLGTIAGVVICLGALFMETAATRNLCRTWHDAETLWTYAVNHGAKSSFEVRNNLGAALLDHGKLEAAKASLTEALRLNPGFEKAHYNLGNVLFTEGNYEEAKAQYTDAVRLDPRFAKAYYNLGVVLATLGNDEAAVAHYTVATRLNPGYFEAYYNLGVALNRLGRYAAAKACFAAVSRLRPAFAEAYSARAMIMAACPEATFRDGERAVKFATVACELTRWTEPRSLQALAAAQAETGDFSAAISSETKALELVSGERERNDCRFRLALYQANRPYREVFPERAPSQARP